ncbi:hypothetical protein, partial [Escherichia coli]|uniref:hypothetical protein n=1 Tax=Escherichia coli TaxID=562 RepID=UPI001BDD7F2E
RGVAKFIFWNATLTNYNNTPATVVEIIISNSHTKTVGDYRALNEGSPQWAMRRPIALPHS